MPSTIGHLQMGQIISKSTRENVLTQEITTKLVTFSQHDHEHTPADIARFIYGNAGSLMGKHHLDSLTYYKCAAKAIKATNNSEEVVTQLIKLIEDSANPLREMIKKGGVAK